MPNDDSIHLRFGHPYKSITHFPDTVISNPSFIAGLNGAGKTHLLQAIDTGAIVAIIGGEAISPDNVKLYDWNSFAMQNAGTAQSSQVYAQAEALWSRIEEAKYGPQVKEALLRFRERRQVNSSDRDLLEQDLDNLEVSSDIKREVAALREQCTELVFANLGESARSRFGRVQSYLTESVHRIKGSDFVGTSMYMDGLSDPLQHQLSQLFMAYRRHYIDNDNARLRSEHRNEQATFLSDDEFANRYGRPPWDVLNDALRDLGMGFRSVEPDVGAVSYKVQLMQDASDEPLDFGQLSSGERILLALAVSLYGMADDRHLLSLPRIMLFDEVDAPLHPAMVRSYLRTIEQFMGGQGIAVVATTHSPSTVALCPPGRVWEMSRGEPRLAQVSNQHALSTLTAGVVALDIRIHDRRQVFVESYTDAELFELLYERYASEAHPDIGLSFIPASASKSSGGAGAVYSMVRALRESGVASCLGVVDWDLRNEPSEDGSVFVLGHGHRYAIENYLFDPLLLVALLAREKRTTQIAGLDETLGDIGTWRGLEQMTSDELQVVIDAFLLHMNWSRDEDSLQVELNDGRTTLLPRGLAQRRGHDLWATLLEKIPWLASFPDNEHGLRRAVARRVAAEIPAIVPREISQLFFRDVRAIAVHTQRGIGGVPDPSRCSPTVQGVLAFRRSVQTPTMLRQPWFGLRFGFSFRPLGFQGLRHAKALPAKSACVRTSRHGQAEPRRAVGRR